MGDQLSPFFASIFPLFPQKRLILRLPSSRFLLSATSELTGGESRLVTSSLPEKWVVILIG